MTSYILWLKKYNLTENSKGENYLWLQIIGADIVDILYSLICWCINYVTNPYIKQQIKVIHLYLLLTTDFFSEQNINT